MVAQAQHNWLEEGGVDGWVGLQWSPPSAPRLLLSFFPSERREREREPFRARNREGNWRGEGQGEVGEGAFRKLRRKEESWEGGSSRLRHHVDLFRDVVGLVDVAAAAVVGDGDGEDAAVAREDLLLVRLLLLFLLLRGREGDGDAPGSEVESGQSGRRRRRRSGGRRSCAGGRRSRSRRRRRRRRRRGRL